MKGGAVASDGRIEPGDMLLQVRIPVLQLVLPDSTTSSTPCTTTSTTYTTTAGTTTSTTWTSTNTFYIYILSKATYNKWEYYYSCKRC